MEVPIVKVPYRSNSCFIKLLRVGNLDKFYFLLEKHLEKKIVKIIILKLTDLLLQSES